VAWLGFAFAVRERVVFPLQTLSNLLGALREGDYSVRGRSPKPDDALGEVMREVNTLGSTLREQRLGAMEATTLLRTVMREIDVAIFAFDEHQRLRLVNRAAERLLAAQPEKLLGQTAHESGWKPACLGRSRTLQASFPGGAGRFGVRRTGIRERGLPLDLVVISDLTQALSEQELQAWQRLVRVLGHELNNSLTPIKSIAGSLASIVARETLADDWRDDMRRGLTVITSRSESLSRFIGAYARLAKLPRPQLQPLEVGHGGARGEFRNPGRGESECGPADDGAGRSRSAGAGADQPAAQCGRRVA
jgi:two-component system, NtrC family, nitrogen regulation sensor histidine kinase NtrY